MIEFFKSKKQDSPQPGRAMQDGKGLEAYRSGCKLADKGKYEEALKYFDTAIKFGINEAYQERALCLNSLDYFLDAIDDFTRAIKFTSEDGNLYYSRGLARNATGDYEGAILDGELACTYSKFDTELNRAREEKYKNSGYDDFRTIYQFDLERWKMNLESHKQDLKFIESLKSSGHQDRINYVQQQTERKQKLIAKNSKRRTA